MGSVYVFRTEASQEELLPFLENLEARGVGIRTDEGLGEILVCHPFHQEVMPV
jgi:CRISPR-associated protein Csx10